jgi:hypothetical protein
MTAVKIGWKLDLSQWGWGEYEKAYEVWGDFLNNMEEAIVADISKIIQEHLDTEGIGVTLSEGTITIIVPLSDEDNEDLTVSVSLARLVDEIIEASEAEDYSKRKETAASLRAEAATVHAAAAALYAAADRLDPPSVVPHGVTP